MVATYEYDVFGALREKTLEADTAFRYTGEQWNAETGFYYLRARYYDPAIGRFLTKDPVPFIQRYAYVGNNPLTGGDPYGYFPSLGDVWDAGRCAANPIGCGKSKLDEVLVDPLLDRLPGGSVAKCVYHHGAVRCAGDWAAGQLLGDKAYADLNVTGGCGVVATGGVQVSFVDGLHPYAGGGLSNSCGVTGSLTVAPRQSISSGWGCGAQASYLFPVNQGAGIGPAAQLGAGGLGGKEGAAFFHEYGLSGGFGFTFGPAGVSGTCYYVW